MRLRPLSAVPVLIAVVVVPTAPAAAHRRATPTLSVSTTSQSGVPRVSRGLVGGNQRWFGNADGALNPNGSLNADIVALSRRIGVRSMRYAGGTVANLFDYRKSIDTPGCQTSGGFAVDPYVPIAPVRSRFTIAKHADFVHAIDGASNLMIPMINTSTARARAFVKAVAAKTGQKRFVVEIGNEPYLDNQHYWRSLDPTTRLHQYINGGAQAQSPRTFNAGTDASYRRLFVPGTCDLSHGAVADNSAGQTYRTRFTPISTTAPPIIDVAEQPWTYVPRLSDHGRNAHVFTIVANGTRIRFGDGVHGAKPSGTMQIENAHPYTAVRQPGFVQFYRALKSLQGTDGITSISVCGGWGRIEFVRAMNAAGHPYDCLAVHSYVTITGAHTAATDYAALQRGATSENRQLLDLRTAMHSAHRFIEVTEFGTLHSSYSDQKKQFLNTLFLTQMMLGQIRAGVPVGNTSNFGTLFRGFPNHRFAISSVGWMESLVHRLAGQRPVRTGGTRHPGVDLVATRRGNVVSAFVLNKRSSGAYAPAISVAQRNGPSCVTVRRMSAAIDADDRPGAPGGKSPSIRPVVSVAWPAGAAFPRGAVGGVAAHSLALYTITPKTAPSCPVPQF